MEKKFDLNQEHLSLNKIIRRLPYHEVRFINKALYKELCKTRENFYKQKAKPIKFEIKPAGTIESLKWIIENTDLTQEEVIDSIIVRFSKELHDKLEN